MPGQGGHHPWAKPDRPVGLFSEGRGCLTHAEGSPVGAGGHMDGVHSMGPGAIMYPLTEHFRLTGDKEWLKANAPRMKANVEWILRQRRLMAGVVPGGERLWCKGLQPAHQVTPDSGGQLMQFYESEAYYWLAVQRFAQVLAQIDAAEGARLAAEAEAYRNDLKAAVERSIALTPVTLVRDGTYRSFIPFACYVRGIRVGRVELAAAGQRPSRRRIVLGHDPVGRPVGKPCAAAAARRPARSGAPGCPGRPVAPGEPEGGPSDARALIRKSTGLLTLPGNTSRASNATPTSTWRPTMRRTSCARGSTSMP